MTCIWKDTYGDELHADDIIEDTERRLIGRVIVSGGYPILRAYKIFVPSILGYEMIDDSKGPLEAYVKPLVKRHTKLWWMMHGYRLDNVEILRKAENMK